MFTLGFGLGKNLAKMRDKIDSNSSLRLSAKFGDRYVNMFCHQKNAATNCGIGNMFVNYRCPWCKLVSNSVMKLLDKSRQQYYWHAREHSFLEIRFQLKSHIHTKTSPLAVSFHSAAREKGVLKTIAPAIDPCHISEYCCMNPSISDFSDTALHWATLSSVCNFSCQNLHNLLTKQTAECEWRVEIRSKGIAMAIPTDLCIPPVLPY